ncbi:GIY-YIG nuclease family protein [Microbacterium lacus]|uniref:GIY-YIG nuclease family protein n=1 Tax=Microbacterium lacus TaxID=415217 RepID=UPI00384C5C02
MPTAYLESPCLLCGALIGVRDAGGRECAVCGWRVGDTPDDGLPRPRIEVVYYLRFADRIKIGTSGTPRSRLGAIWHDELLAFERGGRSVEQQRHREFAAVREGGEWFTADPALVAHAAALRGDTDPWHAYARWVSEAYRGL